MFLHCVARLPETINQQRVHQNQEGVSGREEKDAFRGVESNLVERTLHAAKKYPKVRMTGERCCTERISRLISARHIARFQVHPSSLYCSQRGTLLCQYRPHSENCGAAMTSWHLSDVIVSSSRTRERRLRLCAVRWSVLANCCIWPSWRSLFTDREISKALISVKLGIMNCFSAHTR